jgi:hypothetical protein
MYVCVCMRACVLPACLCPAGTARMCWPLLQVTNLAAIAAPFGTCILAHCVCVHQGKVHPRMAVAETGFITIEEHEPNE